MRIVLLIADSLRADAPSYAGGNCRTPVLDGLARSGAWFSNAFTCAPWTVPSIASMLTGKWAHTLGVYAWEQRLPVEGGQSLFSRMADGGHRVASFVFDPGHLFVSEPEANVVGCSQDLDAVIDWIDQCDAPKLFVLVHYWGTHFPYLDSKMTSRQWTTISDQVLGALKQEPGVVRPKLKGMYQRAVERMDERFLPRLAAATSRHARNDQWMLAVAGDHGESWGEHGPLDSVFDLHGNHLRDEVLHIPWVISGSATLPIGSIPIGKVIGLARTVDLLPTLLEIAGLEPPAGVGRSLRSGVADAPFTLACTAADFVAAADPPRGPEALFTQLSWRDHRFKLVWDLQTDARQVFDLESDPGEEHPRAPGSGEPAEGWQELDRQRVACVCAPPPDSVEERLSALGYL